MHFAVSFVCIVVSLRDGTHQEHGIPEGDTTDHIIGTVVHRLCIIYIEHIIKTEQPSNSLLTLPKINSNVQYILYTDCTIHSVCWLYNTLCTLTVQYTLYTDCVIHYTVYTDCAIHSVYWLCNTLCTLTMQYTLYTDCAIHAVHWLCNTLCILTCRRRVSKKS